MSNAALGMTMLCLIVVVIMMGFPDGLHPDGSGHAVRLRRVLRSRRTLAGQPDFRLDGATRVRAIRRCAAERVGARPLANNNWSARIRGGALRRARTARGLTLRAVVCLRAYKKLPELFDVSVLVVTLDQSQAGVQGRFDAQGLSFANAQKLAGHYLQAYGRVK